MNNKKFKAYLVVDGWRNNQTGASVYGSQIDQDLDLSLGELHNGTTYEVEISGLDEPEALLRAKPFGIHLVCWLDVDVQNHDPSSNSFDMPHMGKTLEEQIEKNQPAIEWTQKRLEELRANKVTKTPLNAYPDITLDNLPDDPDQLKAIIGSLWGRMKGYEDVLNDLPKGE
ncbi:MAG TPA: hypothetical protein VIQ31_05105 [Phormidium sp.]